MKQFCEKQFINQHGILLEFAEGVCGIAYPDTEFKYEIVDVGFCNDATDEQKKKIKEKINSSTIIYKIFENLRMEDIKNLPLDKMKVDMSPKAITERLKTLDDLWLLSVKLMNSKKVKSAKDDKNEIPGNARDSRAARAKNRV